MQKTSNPQVQPSKFTRYIDFNQGDISINGHHYPCVVNDQAFLLDDLEDEEFLEL